MGKDAGRAIKKKRPDCDPLNEETYARPTAGKSPE